MRFLSVILSLTTVLSAQEKEPTGGGSLFGFLLPLIILFAFFYLFLILPQQRREKKHKQMLNTLQKGDRVVTSGGIHGNIHKIEGDVVTLRLGQNVVVKFDKNVIQRVIKREQPK